VTPSPSLVERMRVSGACTTLCSRLRRPNFSGLKSAVSASGLKLAAGEFALDMLAKYVEKGIWGLGHQEEGLVTRKRRLKNMDFRILRPRVFYCTCANVRPASRHT
jgi:hypothetical protein